MEVTLALLLRAVVCGVLCALGAAVGGCSEGGGNVAATRGRQIYLAQCTQCHNPDPAQTGVVGPAVKGSSRELLEAKILRAEYPSGYRPKRSTAIMPAQPPLGPEIPALAEFLR